MSELFMECEEEELQPWQKQIPEVNLIDDDDDDEPIFVGELTSNQKNIKTTPIQRGSTGKIQSATPLPARESAQLAPLPSVTAKAVNSTSHCIKTIPPQSIIVNNQGYIVTSPQLTNHDLLTSLGKQYPPGTSFTIVSGQQHLLPQKSPGRLLPGSGVVHRPQVQQINNNIVTLSNVQNPPSYTVGPKQLQPVRTNTQPIQILTAPVQVQGNRDQSINKRGLAAPQNVVMAKKIKFDLGPNNVIDLVENGSVKFKCPKCPKEFLQEEAMKSHTVTCCVKPMEYALPSPPKTNPANAGKRIMLVTDFYYGHYEGDGHKQQTQKAITIFRCLSCLKVLKNNIRFMNHMKHHLELEKQTSESLESHTTCQHCYRLFVTPFQLQCHIETAHSPFESSTNCKICELAFDSEQLLLEHMKDNHKPGEMPYVCQVCNYRSSFFSDVETHFRNNHNNTKDLLCPFCLKVSRSPHRYMQHYMKHQKKGIYRCGKCRLNFLTYKERVDHKTHFHKTFRKPKALEGLPPGTKVTIRASLSGTQPTSLNTSERLSFSIIPDMTTSSDMAKAQSNTSKSKSNNVAVRKVKKQQSKSNLMLRNLRINGEHHTCLECNTKIEEFVSHYPMPASCAACKYETSCIKAFGNHMIRFHGVVAKNKRKQEIRKKPTVSLTLACLNCDLIVDALNTDLMSKHLAQRPNHVCKVIQAEDAEGEKSPEGEEKPAISEPKELMKTQADNTESDDIILLDTEVTPQQAASDLCKEVTETTTVEKSVDGEPL